MQHTSALGGEVRRPATLPQVKNVTIALHRLSHSVIEKTCSHYVAGVVNRGPAILHCRQTVDNLNLDLLCVITVSGL